MFEPSPTGLLYNNRALDCRAINPVMKHWIRSLQCSISILRPHHHCGVYSDSWLSVLSSLNILSYCKRSTYLTHVCRRATTYRTITHLCLSGDLSKWTLHAYFTIRNKHDKVVGTKWRGVVDKNDRRNIRMELDVE